MNTNLRALLFAAVTTATVAAALTVTLDTVVAAEPVRVAPQNVVRLDAVQVTGHRDHFDADGNLKVIRLEQISVVAHKAAFVG